MEIRSMRIKIVFSTLILLMFNGALLYAQDPGEPCSGNDVDNTGCPLDTWVVLLAFVAIAFAARHLYKQKKKCAIV
jgi:uncharacterized membrane protein